LTIDYHLLTIIHIIMHYH